MRRISAALPAIATPGEREVRETRAGQLFERDCIQPIVAVDIEKATHVARVERNDWSKRGQAVAQFDPSQPQAADRDVDDSVGIQVDRPTMFPLTGLARHLASGDEDGHATRVALAGVQVEMQLVAIRRAVHEVNEPIGIEVGKVGLHVGLLEVPIVLRTARLDVANTNQIGKLKIFELADARITHNAIPGVAGPIGVVPSA